MITSVVVIAAFTAVDLGLFPLPYYLGKAILPAAAVNVIVLGCQLWKKQYALLRKTALLSVVAGALCFVWFVQTA